MTAKQIVVEPYSGKWEQAFLDIRSEIKDALGALVLWIEHAGSTSVRGLSAKPIIDVDAVIKNRSALARAER